MREKFENSRIIHAKKVEGYRMNVGKFLYLKKKLANWRKTSKHEIVKGEEKTGNVGIKLMKIFSHLTLCLQLINFISI